MEKRVVAMSDNRVEAGIVRKDGGGGGGAVRRRSRQRSWSGHEEIE